MQIDKSIFRENDIRGVAGNDFDQRLVEEFEKVYGEFKGVSLTLPVARAIGAAFGTKIRSEGGKKVAVGYELRPFAIELYEAFIKGVISTGIDVISLGRSLTPMVYFTVAKLGLDGGVNVTGSHNIYFYNGFKMMKKGVAPLFDEELQEILKMVEGDFQYKGETEGEVSEFEIYPMYEKYMKEHIGDLSGLKVVTDCGNGSAGSFGPKLLKSLGVEVTELYSEVDAKFPNHVPDPEMEQNMHDLIEKVKTTRVDLGIGFDADGDRVGFVDERGVFVQGDMALLIFADDVLSRNPGKKVLFDVKCSEILFDEIKRSGGVPLMHRTGHAPIKDTLRKDDQVIFGGEISGHFYHVENYFKFDDGLYSALLMLRILKEKKTKMSTLLSQYPTRVKTPEIKLPCVDDKKFKIVEDVIVELENKYRCSKVDGIRFYTSDNNWALIRASNTSPYLTLRFEGKTEQSVLELKNIVDSVLSKYEGVKERVDTENVASLTGKLGWR